MTVESIAEPIVQLASGAVRGAVADGVERFLGISYAAPPVGERRFAAPQPVEPWSGVRDATDPGPNAPQFLRPFPNLDVAPLVGTQWRQGDDFLTLNVWRPAGTHSGLPVMVFIHGGAFVLGSKDAAVHDGSGFARSGAILIAINYRLGVEGFLPIPGAPTNLGLRDQIAALEWVQANAGAFGGDPANITVFGESAGAMSVANLVASPLAKGLFRRAIIQSGHGSMVRPIPVARRLVKRIARLLGVTPDLDGFRRTTMEAGVAALEKVSQPTARIDLRDETGREPTYGLSRFLPVYGDDVLPDRPLDALAKGVGAEVDVLIGSNREEMNLYFVPTGVRPKLNRLLAWFVLRRVEPKARAVLRAYRNALPGQPAGHVFTAAMTDLVFRLPARWFAAAHRGRTHVYEFDWRSTACNGELGACHGIELPFVFDTLAAVTGPQGLAGGAPPQALADRVHALWVAFASDGQLPWADYDAQTRQVFSIEKGRASTEPPMPAEHHVG
jgi:para-nitrobenzyl esterase